MQGSISNDQNFKMHSKTNGKPMKGLKHGGKSKALQPHSVQLVIDP